MNNTSFLDENKYIRDMEIRAREEYIPIISREVGQFLNMMLTITQPKLILEIGTAIGYSTIIMAKSVSTDTEIVTIERDEERALEAKKNFAHYNFTDKINLKIGDALDILPLLRRKFDFVFIDAAKGQYLNFLDNILDLLVPNGVIIADNVLYRGYVKKDKKIKHKRRTMVKKLRRYNEVIKDHDQLNSIILPIGDGIAMSIRRNCNE